MMEILFMEEVLSEERQLTKWVGIFQVEISWVGVFRKGFPGGDLKGGNFPVAIFPGAIFLEPILILNLAESVIMRNRLNVV